MNYSTLMPFALAAMMAEPINYKPIAPRPFQSTISNAERAKRKKAKKAARRSRRINRLAA